jgi:DNA-binding winged helix-turn-helix (wHTH) protein
VTAVRYRFANFVVSTRQRTLWCDGREVALIPRYFDLLVLLLQHRDAAVHRQVIFDRVWNDVVVSDGALSQAIRTIRRTLGDDSREPTFIRTVSRHGYRFAYAEVVEEPDDGPPARTATSPDRSSADSSAEPIESLLTTLTAERDEAAPPEDRRDAAERLLAREPVPAVLEQLERRSGRARALALLRDARWEVPGAGAVPIVRSPGGPRALAALVRLRIARAGRAAAARWASAAAGTAVAGAAAGAGGGLLLWGLPGAGTPITAVPVLASIGAVAGAVGAAGVGAGLAGAEAIARSRRGTMLILGGGLGGALVATIAIAIVRWTLDGLFGLQVQTIDGPLEGFVIGAAAGLAYASGTAGLVGGGMATPHGRDRLILALRVACACGIAAAALSASGRPMVGGLVNQIAHAVADGRIALAPLGRLLGEPDVGALTGAALGAFEGACFGFGLAAGLTRRPW